jgi:hypothetical protein
LKLGTPNGKNAEMIGSSLVARSHEEAVEHGGWPEHRLPHLAKIFPALQRHSADASGAVVEHEHRLEFVELLLVRLSVRLRAEQSFLLGTE